MSGPIVGLNQLRATLDALPTPPRREIVCGAAVPARLREVAAPQQAAFPDRSNSLNLLQGVPIIVDPTMPIGAWEFREDDVVVGSGYVDGFDRPGNGIADEQALRGR